MFSTQALLGGFHHNISPTPPLINIIVQRSIGTKAQRTEDRRRMTDKEGILNPRFREDRYRTRNIEYREFRNEDFRSFDPSAALRAGFLSLRADSTRDKHRPPIRSRASLRGQALGRHCAGDGKLKPYHYLLSEYVRHSWFPSRHCRSV